MSRSEELSKQLNSYGFKPSEHDSGWADYWKFQTALEKGDSAVGRSRRGAAAQKPRKFLKLLFISRNPCI